MFIIITLPNEECQSASGEKDFQCEWCLGHSSLSVLVKCIKKGKLACHNSVIVQKMCIDVLLSWLVALQSNNFSYTCAYVSICNHVLI